MNNDERVGRIPNRPDPKRLHAGNAEKVPCKLGTMTKTIWVYDKDIPFGIGDVIRWTERERGRASRGRCIAIRAGGRPFIARDAYESILDEPGSGTYPAGSEVGDAR